MVFHIEYELLPEFRNESQTRFRATGAQPPPGVTMTARWHFVQGRKGFFIAETSDAEAIAKWLQGWTDLVTFKVTPVINDDQLARVLG
jgi:Domain of unknown function (DUF3303)